MSDICFLLEGTYPYVSGGVSSWVADIITSMPDLEFSIVYLGAHRDSFKSRKYAVPSNVTGILEYYIFDYSFHNKGGSRIIGKNRRLLADFLAGLIEGETAQFEEVLEILGDKRITLFDLTYSKESWEIMMEVYRKKARDISFIDFFWSWRFIYLPMFSLMKIDLPLSGVYHSVSTGYAGLLGSIAKIKTGCPYILTEHGIYTRERKIEILHAEWIKSSLAEDITVTSKEDFFKQWWVKLFSFFSITAYNYADSIYSIYEGNSRIQISEGAPAEKVSVIPNGIEQDRFGSFTAKRKKGRFRIGFIGRIVKIKDVKTFIRACDIACRRIPEAEAWMLGPYDEEKQYYEECKKMIKDRGLEEKILFKGKVDINEYIKELDVVVLTSISEGQPFVILEANLCGIPVIATDAGACRELLEGRGGEDRSFGQSGIITPQNAPESTAQAMVRLYKESDTYRNMSSAGIKRVKKYYNKDEMTGRYRSVYIDGKVI
ncbi:MAG: GT4 family glycosyltransferase PelF [Elusimicrobiota bacterium]